MIKGFTHYIIFAICLFISQSEITSQNGWVVQSSGTVQNLYSASFINSSVGVAVGNAGTILRTSNGGTNWIAQNSGTPNHLFGAFLLNSSTGWVSGDVGVILKTTNSGASWTLQNSTSVYQLHQLQFLNTTTGYCAGWYGTILKTTDGGTTWISQFSGTIRNLLGISFVNANTGYVSGGYGTILSTTNGGTTWNILTSGTTLSLENIYFSSSSVGIVIGESGRVQKTTNSGVNWTVQTSGTGSWLMGVWGQNGMFSTIVGESGTIRKTSNGGTNWYSQTSNTGNYLNFVSFIDTSTGTAVGDYGTIIHTTTGGWLPPTAPALSSPANGATCFSLTGTLSWGAVSPPASYYRVQISLNSNFTTTVLDTNQLMNPSYAIQTGLLNYNVQYYWRVMATNQVGTGPWSGTRNFTTTLATPVAPNLVAPPNNSSGQSLTPLLDWDSVASATTYRLRLSADSTFTTSLIDTAGLAATQYQVPSGRLSNNVKYYWRVNGINSCTTGANSATWNFRTLVTGLINVSGGIPKIFRLYNNYPNPFNPVTQIRFDLPEDNFVVLKIYNVLGDEVASPVNEFKKAGQYNISLSFENFASGIYLYKINAGSFTDIKKMVLIK